MSVTGQQADTVLQAGWVIPIEPRGQVLPDHALVLRGGRIEALLPNSEADRIDCEHRLALPGHAVMPGLVNCHGHSAMSLLRGFADDLPLMPWLTDHVWPAEGAFVSEQFVHDGAELAIAEMLRSGTTCFSDMYFFPNRVAALCQHIGMRSQLSFPVFDFPSAWGRDASDYLAKGLALRDDYRHSSLINVVFGPHSVYTLSEEHLARVATLAAELDVPAQIHLHESQAEVDNALREFGERPLQRLERLGLLGPRTQCVHMTALDESDIERVARAGAHIVHCPQSNMKLASGLCPVNALQAAGVNVALGTDSAASNNDLNLFGELQTAAMLAKLESGNAAAVSAEIALEMATLGGARALGLDHDIGSLVPGKAADLIAVDLSGPETQPLYNPISQLAYAVNGSQVTHAWVNGAQLLHERALPRIDLNDLQRRINGWQTQIQAHQETST